MTVWGCARVMEQSSNILCWGDLKNGEAGVSLRFFLGRLLRCVALRARGPVAGTIVGVERPHPSSQATAGSD